MSQDDIVKLLLKKKKPLTSKEIAELLEIRQQAVLASIRKLLKYKEIQQKKPTEEEFNSKGYPKSYRHKRFWLYYID
jgi:transcription initiation factor IIE alpha subunit